MCRVLEKTERGLGVREGWGGGAGVSSFLSTQHQGAVAGGPSPPPEAQCGDLGNQGDGSHGAAQGGFEGPVAWAHLPRTGVKSPGLSALLEANGLMEGRTMRAKESSRTCGDGDGGGAASFPRPHPGSMPASGARTPRPRDRIGPDLGLQPCCSHSSSPFPSRRPLRRGRGPPSPWGPPSEPGGGLTAMQVPAWADLLVDWTTMAWSFFSCSKRDLSGSGQPWLSPTGPWSGPLSVSRVPQHG